MKNDKAFELINELGKFFKAELVNREIIEPDDGFESDLFNGLAAVIKLELKDEHIPGVEKAFETVMEACSKAAFEMVLAETTACNTA